MPLRFNENTLEITMVTMLICLKLLRMNFHNYFFHSVANVYILHGLIKCNKIYITFLYESNN